MELSIEMLVTIGGVSASVIGSFAVVQSKVSQIESDLRAAQKSLRLLDSRLDKNDTSTDLVGQRLSVISGMMDPTKREILHRSLERLKVENETLRRDVDVLRHIHNGRHWPTGDKND